VVLYFFDSLSDFPARWFHENTRSLLFYFLFSVYLSLVIIEYLRFKYEWAQKAFMIVAGKLLKPEETENSHGSLPFFLGLAFCTAFFQKEITIIAFLSLMIGDPLAAWFGIKYGKHKIKGKKSLEGFFAGTMGSFAAGIIFLFINMIIFPESFFAQSLANSPVIVLLVLFLSSLAAFTGELFSSSGFFDDNFVIPVLTGLSLSILMMIFFHLNFNDLFYSAYDLLMPLP
jgi:dolichol kinase